MKQTTKKRIGVGFSLLFIVSIIFLGFYKPVLAVSGDKHYFGHSGITPETAFLNRGDFYGMGSIIADGVEAFGYLGWRHISIDENLTEINGIGVKFKVIDDSTGELFSPDYALCPNSGSGYGTQFMLINENNYTNGSFSIDSLYSSSNAIVNTGNWILHNDGSCTSTITGIDYNGTITAGTYTILLRDYQGNVTGFSPDPTTGHDRILSFTGDDSDNEVEFAYSPSHLLDSNQQTNDRTFTQNFSLGNFLPNIEFYLFEGTIDEGEGGGLDDITACNPFSSNIETAFLNINFKLGTCVSQIATILFVPTETSTSQFVSLIDEIKQKPPFGWVVGIQQLLQNITTEETEPIFVLEQVTPITDNIFNPIKIALSWLLYFSFAFYLFKRFKDITL
jgi:hypothetical protein